LESAPEPDWALVSLFALPNPAASKQVLAALWEQENEALASQEARDRCTHLSTEDPILDESIAPSKHLPLETA
jgi:hypothetical protein